MKWPAWRQSALRSLLIAAALLLSALLAPASLQATTLVPLDAAQIMARAELIFEGRVIHVEALDTGPRTIHSVVRFEVLRVLKGDYAASSLELRYLGGEVGNRRLDVQSMQIPDVGEHGIYFVESLDAGLVHPLVGWSQGQIILSSPGLPAGARIAQQQAPTALINWPLINRPRWPGASTQLFTGIPGASPSGTPWALALQQSAEAWGSATGFEFQLSPDYRDPCLGTPASPGRDGLNGVDFKTSICGTVMSDFTLAVTMFYTERNRLGSTDMAEADIVFNGRLDFDIYDGPLRRAANGRPIYDFRRVALHELGHVMGLDHDDSEHAIMNTRIGDEWTLQSADIGKASALYAGIDNCVLSGAGFGWHFGALEPGDCRVQQLMSGGSDSSFVDIYALSLPQAMRVQVDINTDNDSKSGGRLEAVLMLASQRLGNFHISDVQPGSCEPTLQADLPAGDYVILVNTYSDSTPCQRSTVGDYRLSVTQVSAQLLPLAGYQSFMGGETAARFFGGITTDGGLSYSNRVAPDQLFDALGRIEIDPRHQGQPGFLAVAAITHTGETLVMSAQREFVAYQPEQQRVPVMQRKQLSAVENIEIFRQFKASMLGIQSISVDFLIGYGLDSNPDELYFHQQGINLLVE